MPPPAQASHWIVPAYHRMRALSCAYTLVFCALHAKAMGASAAMGVALVLQFLVYPHLLYWRARRTMDSLRAERQNLLLDIALWGLWSAALGFPPWITFTLFITAGVNHAITGGNRERARCLRVGQPMAVMMLDIDHFKAINDTHGHQAGDQVLRHMGALLKAHSRTEDIPCRIGGEEFVLVLPGMAAAQAMERAQRIRQAFAASEASSDADPAPPATVSIGVAMFPDHGSSMDDLMRSADAAMYAVKRAGRNGVRLHDQPRPAPSPP